jgi:hypothetical protein
MGRSLRWLRTLVVAHWALFVAGIVIESQLWDGMPAELRDYDPYADAALDGMAAWLLGLLSYALLITGSVGVLLALPPARILYTAGILLGIPVVGIQGHWVMNGHAAPFHSASGLALGVTLALLWFSPAAQAFGTAPEPLAMRSDDGVGRALRGGAMIVVGALAGLGILSIGFISAGVLYMIGIERTEAAAQAVGRGANAEACVAAALERARASRVDWFEHGFLTSCLDVATDREAFCASVPPFVHAGDEPGLMRFATERCKGAPDLDTCAAIYATVQMHCHPSDLSDPDLEDASSSDD